MHLEWGLTMRLQIMPWGTFSWESQCKHLVLARGGRESRENTAPYMWSVPDFERPLQGSLDTVEVSIHSPQEMVCWVSQWWTWETRSWEMLQTSWWQISQGPRLDFLGFWVQSGFPRVLKLYNILKGIRSSWIATMLLDWYNSHQCNVAQSWTCADRERQSERRGGWLGGERDRYLIGCSSFTKEDGLTMREQKEVIKQIKDFTARLVNGSNDSTPISCQVLQCCDHKESWSTASNKKKLWQQLWVV